MKGRRLLAAAAVAALAASLVSLVAAANAGPAAADPTPPDHLVISEVNGDQSGVYRTNWVELYNPTDTTIDLGSIDTTTSPATVTPKYFLCYASLAGSTCTSPYKLYGKVLAHHHFLIELYDAGSALPAWPAGVTPDLNFGSTDPTVNPSQQAAKNIGGSGTGGQLLLLDASADPTGAYPTAANDPSSTYSSTNRNLADPSINPSPVVDAMGFAPAASTSTLGGSEGWVSSTDAHSAPVQDTSHWDARIFVNGVPQDTDDNAADFQVSQRDPISQVSSRVAVAPISDTTVATNQPMTAITVAGSQGIGTLSYAATGLPEGVAIDPSTGVISGTPAAADTVGAYHVTVTVSDQTPGTPDTATASFTLTLSTALRIDPIANVSVDKGDELTPIQVQAHGGTPDYSYAATGLPDGVSIDSSSGAITGTPTGPAGKYSVHVTVKDSGTGTGADAQQTATADFSITELPATTGPGGGDPLAGLRINEVEATGTTADDWVELYNTGAAITNGSVELSDSSGATYHLTGLTIAANGFAVVEGSDLDSAGLDLAANDTLYLSEAGGDTLLDQTSWTSYPTTSWARYPDGTGDFAASKQATKDAANSLPASFATDHLVIAAVFGANSDTVRFTNDWIELYNPTDAPISLGTIDTTTTPNATITPNYDLCYRSYSSTGACSNLLKLYGTVSPHHYFFIWVGNAHTPADDGTYPAGFTPDLDFAVKTPADGNQSGPNMGGCNTGGQLELLDTSKGTSSINGDLSSPAAKAAGEVDGVGWMNASTNQPSAAESKGLSRVTGVNSGTNNTCVIARNFTGGNVIDTDVNSTDFAPMTDLSAFTPHSQASDRVTVAPVADTEISLNESMAPIQVQATAIYGALTFSAAGLPAGITIDPNTGVISGTPDPSDALMSYPVTITVGDGVASDTATISFNLTVSKILRLEPIDDVSVAKGTPITAIHPQAHGGTPSYTYAATGLPDGLTIDSSTGVISGSPTDALGHYSVHVTVTDSGVGTAKASTSQDFTVVELPPPGGPAPGDPLAGLTLNEVKATGTASSDWIELYNTGAGLTGVSLRIEDGEGDTYALPKQDIAAHAFVVVDGPALQAAGFHLAASDTLYLTETDDTLLDRTSWTAYEPTSWARATDGVGAFGISAYATKGAANSGPPVIHPNDLLVTEVNYDNNSTDYYEYSEVTNTTDHPIDFDAYGLSVTKSGAVMTLHDPSDTSGASPVVDPVIPARGTLLMWWDENQYLGVKTTAQFLANYGLPASTPVVLVQGFTSLANSGGDHSYYISVNQGSTFISQAWVDTPCPANTFNGSSVCTATNGNYAEHYAVPADRTDPVAAVWYDSLHTGGDDINFALQPPLSTPGSVDLEQLGFSRALKINDVSSAEQSVTLANTSGTPVDLSGYALQNKSGQVYTLPAGTTIVGNGTAVITWSGSGFALAPGDWVMLLAPQGYAYTDGVGLIDTTGPILHTLPYDASSGQPPVIDPTSGLPLPPAGGLYRPAGVSGLNGTVFASNTGDNLVAAMANGSNTIIAGALSRYGFDSGQNGGAATDASLYQPTGTAVDANGNLFIADSGDNLVLEITKADGTIHVVAGTGDAGGAQAAITRTSTATAVNLDHPESVAVDANGDLYIADTFDNRVVMVTPSGALRLVAGTGKAGYSGDGAAATAATLTEPAGVAVDSVGNVYIADSSNNVIRRVDATTGVITTVAGDYAIDKAGNDCVGSYSGDGGPATSAQLNDPQGIAVDGAGDLFIADTFNNAIREVTPDGTISTVVNVGAVAGSEKPSPVGNGALPAVTDLNTPYAVSVDAATDAMYIADTRNSSIAEVLNVAEPGDSAGPIEPKNEVAVTGSGLAFVNCAQLPIVSVPVITSVTPANGPRTGGTTVTLTGHHFTGVTAVRFGTTAGTGLDVLDDSHLTVTAPAHAAGRVDVIATNAVGDSGTTAADQFTYQPLVPVVTGVAPTSGLRRGGTNVTVTGSHFTGTTGVTFGSSAGTNVIVVDDSHLSVTSPSHAAGAVDIVVTNADGASATVGADRFTYTKSAAPASTCTYVADYANLTRAQAKLARDQRALATAQAQLRSAIRPKVKAALRKKIAQLDRTISTDHQNVRAVQKLVTADSGHASCEQQVAAQARLNRAEAKLAKDQRALAAARTALRKAHGPAAKAVIRRRIAALNSTIAKDRKAVVAAQQAVKASQK